MIKTLTLNYRDVLATVLQMQADDDPSLDSPVQVGTEDGIFLAKTFAHVTDATVLADLGTNTLIFDVAEAA